MGTVKPHSCQEIAPLILRLPVQQNSSHKIWPCSGLIRGELPGVLLVRIENHLHGHQHLQHQYLALTDPCQPLVLSCSTRGSMEKRRLVGKESLMLALVIK